jgi:iron(III) transport system ATP-binding protein
MRAELKRIHDETGHTIVFVTHDQLEAMTMATHVVVMNKGVVQQMAPPMEVYNRPANTFVARFVGSPPMNLFEAGGGTDAADDGDTGDTFTRAARERVLADRPDLAGVLATVGARPEGLRMLRPDEPEPAGCFVFDATVKAALPTGSSWTVLVTAGRSELYLVAYTDVSAAPGTTVRCAVRVTDLHLFDTSGTRLPDIAAPAAPTEENTATWAS